jgi:hypothetical protein
MMQDKVSETAGGSEVTASGTSSLEIIRQVPNHQVPH